MTSLLFLGLALLGSIVAAASICVLHGSKPNEVLRERPFRYGTFFIAIPAIAAGFLAHALTADWSWAAAAGLAAATPVLFWFRGLRKRARIMMAPTASEVAAEVARLRAARPPEGSTSLLFDMSVITSATQLCHVGQWSATFELLGLLNFQLAAPNVLVEGACLLARCYLANGLVERARTALELGRAQVGEHGDVVAFGILDARVLVHERKPNKALNCLPDPKELAKKGSAFEVEALIVRIHAGAAKNDEEATLALIGSLREKVGPNALSLLRRPEGPASALAGALGSRNAYR